MALRVATLVVIASLAPATASAWNEGFYTKLADKIRAVRSPSYMAKMRLRMATTPLPVFDSNFRSRPGPLDTLDFQEVARAKRAVQRVEGVGVKKTRMGAFERLVARHAPKSRARGLYIVSDLHLIKSMEPLFEAVVDSGAPEGKLLLQGVRHSQQKGTVHELQRNGVPVRPAEVGGRRGEYRYLLKRLVNKARREPNARFLVLGHGGMLHAALTSVLGKPGVPKDLTKRVVIVETTHKGELRMNRLRRKMAQRGEKSSERFPVVDIGGHWAKTVLESPTIGAGAAVSMNAELQNLARHGYRGFDLRSKKVPVLMIGYGNVGRHTARALKRLGYQVGTYDRSGRARRRAHADGVTVFTSLDQALASNPRAIACATGETPIPAKSVKAIPNGAALFNLASPGELKVVMDHAARQANSQFQGRRLPTVNGPADHQHLSLRAAARSFLIPRGGQVINLAMGAKEPDAYIQLTRGLVYMAMNRGATLFGKRPGHYDLDNKQVRSFIVDIQRDLKAGGLGPLQTPTLKAFGLGR